MNISNCSCTEFIILRHTQCKKRELFVTRMKFPRSSIVDSAISVYNHILNQIQDNFVRYLTLALVLLASSTISATTVYISDSLDVFYRSGPTNQYRILGTLKSGVEVELLQQDAENGSSQIRLASGREVWIDTSNLITTKPNYLQLEELRREYQQYRRTTTGEIADLQSNLKQARDLAAASERLQQRIAKLELDNEALTLRNQALSDRSRYDLITAGGIVAILGIFVGLILPKLITRKRDDGWR